jgi:hypothetical protein
VKWIKIKYISKQDVEKLLANGIIRNTNRGYVNKDGYEVGFYRTKSSARKRYIQDEYVDLLETIK